MCRLIIGGTNMKKALAAGILVLGLSTSCYAYENTALGYSVKEGTPMLVVENKNALAYSNFASKSMDAFKDDKNIVSYTIIQAIGKDDMSQALEKSFTTSYFNQELEKIALDNGKNAPKSISKLADMDIYITNDDKELEALFKEENSAYKNLIGDNTVINVKKVGKGKALEFNNYFSEDNIAFMIKTTVLSANDKVYSITTIGIPPNLQQATVDKAVKVQEKSEEITKEAIIEPVQKTPEIIAIKEQDFGSKNIKQFKAIHNKTLKSFKTFVPSGKEHIFGYRDSVTKKFMQLPKEWFYVTGNFAEAKSSGTFTFAANSLEILRGLKEANDYRTSYMEQHKDEDGNFNKTFDECMKLFLKNVNGFKVSSSFKINDDTINEVFGNPLQTKLVVDQTLRETFKRAEQFTGPNFKLNKYNFDTSFTETDGKVVFEILGTHYKAFTYRANFVSDYSAIKNIGNLTLDVNKTQLITNAETQANNVVSNLVSIVTQKNSGIQ